MCPVIFLVFLSWLQNSYNSYKHYFFLQPQLKHVVEGVGGASGISHLLPPNSEGRKDTRSTPPTPAEFLIYLIGWNWAVPFSRKIK